MKPEIMPEEKDLPMMDAVDLFQQKELEQLKQIDRKHDRQFAGVIFFLTIILAWNLALTFYNVR